MYARTASISLGSTLLALTLGCGEPSVDIDDADAPGWHDVEVRPNARGSVPVVAKEPARTLDPEQQSRLAVPFVPNGGQWPDEVAFQAQHFAGELWITRDGALVVSLNGPVLDEDSEPPPSLAFGALDVDLAAADSFETGVAGSPFGRERQPEERAPGWTLVERFVNGTPALPRGVDEAVTRVSYFLGNESSNWVSGAKTYGAVTLGEVWPGVEVRLEAHGNNVEKLFHVAPGRDPSVIEMGLEGTRESRLSDEGTLLVRTGHGIVELSAPVAFQEIDGQRRAVEVRYLVTDAGYRFALGSYDERFELVIDPLLQSTYLGGTGSDDAAAMAVDAGGNVLVVGRSYSLNYPGTAGGAQPANVGPPSYADIVVSRLNGDLTTLMQSTYLGGTNNERAHAVALDAGGNVLIAGYSSSVDYPGTAGSAQSAKGGHTDIVVSRLSGDLTTLLQSTYLGGTENDATGAMALDASGNVLVAATSASSDFPGTAGSAQATYGGGSRDIVVCRLSGDLTTHVRSTFLGGTSFDVVSALTVDAGGNVLVAGYSSSVNYPKTAGGAQPASGGVTDIVVSRLSGDLTTLLQSTYLGGTGGEEATTVVLDASGSVLVAGESSSTNYPDTAGGAQPASGGGSDIVVSRLSGDLTTLLQSSYLGGTGGEFEGRVAVDASGDVLVAGSSYSTDYPETAGGAQPTSEGGNEIVVSRLSGDLTTLLQSTYLGGTGGDFSDTMVLDTSGDVLVAGHSDSSDFIGTTGGAQEANAEGTYDIVVSRLTSDLRLVWCGDGIISTGEECDRSDVAGAECPAGFEGPRVCHNDPAYAEGNGTCTLASAQDACADIDECLMDNGGCDSLTTCTNIRGGRTCGACPIGYTGDGESGCSDIDECLTDNGACDALTTCTNVAGGRTCGACPSGYTGDGGSGCVDSDECLTDNGGCDALTTCANIPGGRTCGACPSGYTGDGESGCVDSDECLTDNGGCDALTTCTNFAGGRTCGACPSGYTGDGESGCVDSDPPETTIVDAPDSTTIERGATFGFACDEDPCTSECSLDGEAFAGCISPRAYFDLAEGTHRFQVRAADAIGNTDPTPAVHSWTIVSPIVCGDGAIEQGEGCDDGNTVSGDGCSGSCEVEAGYLCAGAPSVCALETAGEGDAGALDPQADGGSTGVDASGCTCSAGGAPDPSLVAFALALLLGARARRRRSPRA